MTVWLKVFSISIIAINIACCPLYAKDVIKVVYFDQFEPLSWRESGQMHGVFIDAVNAVFKTPSTPYIYDVQANVFHRTVILDSIVLMNIPCHLVRCYPLELHLIPDEPYKIWFILVHDCERLYGVNPVIIPL